MIKCRYQEKNGDGMCILSYGDFAKKLENFVYKNYKSDLLIKIAYNPDRYIGNFRPVNPKIKLMQNVVQSYEIGFVDFMEYIVREYLGKFYKTLPNKERYQDDIIYFDQLFIDNDTIYMIEQKMRDDHDSAKKRGFLEDFYKNIDYLKMKFPDKKIEAIMWFVDDSLSKNKKYYLSELNKKIEQNININLFYGKELMDYLGKCFIWDEILEYLEMWKKSSSDIELNFEKDWLATREELINNVSKFVWKKIINNKEIVDEILPILFPGEGYKEILKEVMK